MFRSTTVPTAVPETSKPQTRLLLATGATRLVLPTFDTVLPLIVCTPVAETIIPMVWVENDASGVLLFVTLVTVLLTTVCAPPAPSTDMPK